jgi:hypothetical protein
MCPRDALVPARRSSSYDFSPVDEALRANKLPEHCQVEVVDAVGQLAATFEIRIVEGEWLSDAASNVGS